MPTRAELIERASKLPLLDAAFLLWIYKFEIDQEENSDLPRAKQVVNNERDFIRVASKIAAQIFFERRNAHFGLTFDRTKTSHPEESAENIRYAIQRAVKFDSECVGFFEYSDNLSNDVDRAIKLASQNNPGFLEATHSLAHGKLIQNMR
ncbi:hypothetical protein [Bosea sp. OK403]|uniref:hypothetical protein n=1 Tax=Bosea sp. OK403 TaxID=1855286 RepID=UPI001113C0B4|nr:hypothetical protein [Bosea sp. OK403]